MSFIGALRNKTTCLFSISLSQTYNMEGVL